MVTMENQEIFNKYFEPEITNANLGFLVPLSNFKYLFPFLLAQIFIPWYATEIFEK
jgi:hypothetical protein